MLMKEDMKELQLLDKWCEHQKLGRLGFRSEYVNNSLFN